MLADGRMQMEREGNEMVEMVTVTVDDESSTTNSTISIDEQMIGWLGGKRDGTTLRIPPIPEEMGYGCFCDRGYNLSFSVCQLLNNHIKQ